MVEPLHGIQRWIHRLRCCVFVVPSLPCSTFALPPPWPSVPTSQHLDVCTLKVESNFFSSKHFLEAPCLPTLEQTSPHSLSQNLEGWKDQVLDLRHKNAHCGRALLLAEVDRCQSCLPPTRRSSRRCWRPGRGLAVALSQEIASALEEVVLPVPQLLEQAPPCRPSVLGQAPSAGCRQGTGCPRCRPERGEEGGVGLAGSVRQPHDGLRPYIWGIQMIYKTNNSLRALNLRRGR